MRIFSKSKKYFTLLMIVVLALIIYFISLTPLIQNPLKQVTDFKFKKFPLNEKPAEDILLVVIDDSSLQYFQDNGISFPWPRIFYAKVVDYLNNAGATAIFFDIIYSENDLNRDEIDAEFSDNEFAKSLFKMDNVYLASQMVDDRRFSKQLDSSMTLDVAGDIAELSEYPGLITPIDKFTAAANTGYVNIFPDSDGVIRRAKLLSKIDNKVFPSLLYRLYSDQVKQTTRLNKNGLQLPKQKIPTDSKTNFLISWYQHRSFKYYPFKALMQSATAMEYGMEQTIDSSIFKDKIIMIGATASGLKDIRAVPIDANIPGIEIWATALSNFIQAEYQHVLSGFWNFLLILIVALKIYFLAQIRNKRWSYILIIVFLLAIFGFDLFVWNIFRLQIDLISLVTVAVFSFIIMQVIQYIAEVKHKQELKKTFGRYLNDNLVELISKDDSVLKMGGNESTVSVLFSDIYDFTTISEKLQPHEIVATLNEYFDDLTRFVLDNDGLLDKYTGDGIMAVFGSPLPDKLHAFKACTALAKHKEFCQDLLAKDNLKFSEQIHLQTRLAVNSGVAVTGNIGSTKRMDFTAIGDTVNLAARLEAVNKIYGTNYLISDDTYMLVKDEFIVRKLDKVMVKGKTEATTIYELLGTDESLRNEKIINYEKAWSLYADRHWEAAKSILSTQLDDQPSVRLLERIGKLLIEQPKDWSDTLKLYTK